MNARPHRILLVDDNLDQQFLSTHALTKALHDQSTINLANSGNEAIAYMIGEGKYADRKLYPFPTLVITDLNMPDGDGFDVLEFMQANRSWSLIPRIIFSSSDDTDDIRTAHQLGASAYHLKPGEIDALENQMAQIIAYWSTNQIAPVDTAGRLIRTRTTPHRGARYPQAKQGDQMERPPATD